MTAERKRGDACLPLRGSLTARAWPARGCLTSVNPEQWSCSPSNACHHLAAGIIGIIRTLLAAAQVNGIVSLLAGTPFNH